MAPSFLWDPAGYPMNALVPQDLPLVTSAGGGAAVIPISVMAPIEFGAYQVTAGESHGPFGAWSAAAMVTVGNQQDLDFPVPIRLEAWDFPSSIRPGDSLVVDLSWRALGKVDAYYSVFVKLLDANNRLVVGWDGQPGNGQRPTLLWWPGESIEDQVSLVIPEDAPPGNYRLEVGMYRAEDLARCLTLDASGQPVPQVAIGNIVIR
jgi:hypothetical protein